MPASSVFAYSTASSTNVSVHWRRNAESHSSEGAKCGGACTSSDSSSSRFMPALGSYMEREHGRRSAPEVNNTHLCPGRIDGSDAISQKPSAPRGDTGDQPVAAGLKAFGSHG